MRSYTMTKLEILKQINELTSVLMADNTDNEKSTLEMYINDYYEKMGEIVNNKDLSNDIYG